MDARRARCGMLSLASRVVVFIIVLLGVAPATPALAIPQDIMSIVDQMKLACEPVQPSSYGGVRPCAIAQEAREE